MPAYGVLNAVYTEKVKTKTIYDTGNDIKRSLKQSKIARVAKETVREPQSVTPVIVTMKT